MPSFRALSIFFAVAVSVAAATSLVVPSSDTLCGNGAVCFASETCVSQVKNSGHKYACAPFSNAHVCSDSRFSCPANSVCNYANRSCDSPQGKNDMAITRNGHLAAGASKPTPNDGLCAYLADIIPSFCTCAQDQTGTQAQISCQVWCSVLIVIMNSKHSHHAGQLRRCGHHWLDRMSYASSRAYSSQLTSSSRSLFSHALTLLLSLSKSPKLTYQLITWLEISALVPTRTSRFQDWTSISLSLVALESTLLSKSTVTLKS
jgi:hypothetical protein